MFIELKKPLQEKFLCATKIIKLNINIRYIQCRYIAYIYIGCYIYI